jgi:hypothetical protein
MFKTILSTIEVLLLDVSSFVALNDDDGVAAAAVVAQLVMVSVAVLLFETMDSLSMLSY